MKLLADQVESKATIKDESNIPPDLQCCSGGWRHAVRAVGELTAWLPVIFRGYSWNVLRVLLVRFWGRMWLGLLTAFDYCLPCQDPDVPDFCSAFVKHGPVHTGSKDGDVASLN